MLLFLITWNPSAAASTLTLRPDPSLRRYVNADVEMSCTITSEPSATSRYAVTWLFGQQIQNLMLLSMDQDGLVTFGPTVEPNDRKRISAMRPSRLIFQLSIRQAQTSDQGYYRCEVVELLQTSKSQWYSLPPRAATIQLTLTEPGTFGGRTFLGLNWKTFVFADTISKFLG